MFLSFFSHVHSYFDLRIMFLRPTSCLWLLNGRKIMVHFAHGQWLPPMPCMKRVYRYRNRRRSTVQQPRTESTSRPAVKSQLNCGSTAGFVPPSVCIGFRWFVLLGRFADVSSMLWSVRGRLVCSANTCVCIQSCTTPPRNTAVRSVPTRQWYVRVLD